MSQAPTTISCAPPPHSIFFAMLFLQGKIFFKKDDTPETFWDVVEDEKYEVKPPEAKRQKTEE